MKSYISDLKGDFYRFVNEHESEDVANLKLKYSSAKLEFPLDFALTQIALRSKNRNKLKSFIANQKFIFPNAISSEQSSDELVASYNASTVGSGMKVLDMTAGLGIDSLSMVLAGNHVTSIELDSAKCEALQHNSQLFVNPDYHTIICGDSLAYAKEVIDSSIPGSYSFDVVYIDPARRDNSNKRTYSFSDCQPDIIANMDLLLALAPKILVKASPLLDISQVFSEIKNLSSLHIVSARGECKELLLEIAHDADSKTVKIVELDSSRTPTTLQFTEDEIHDTHAPIIDDNSLVAGYYLYEPNPGLMKVTAYGALCKKFPNLKKVSPNTSLYVSENLIKDFPGRILRIEKILDKKDVKSLKGERINVSVRNYPISAQELSKKIKNKEGDNRFLYAFRAYSSAVPIMLLTSKIS